MSTFLKELAQALYEEHGEDTYKLCVVLPSRRASLYFKNYLAEIAQKDMIAPTVQSMDDFVHRLSDLQVTDYLSLLFELYQSYRKFDQAEDHTLEQFIPLGGQILKDFSLIDKNLSFPQAKKLFETLEETKAVERWAEELGKPFELKESSSLKDFFNFWKFLTKTYFDYRQKLLSENKAYSGLAYRLVYENIDERLKNFDYKKIIFAGFFQLTVVEEHLIQKLVQDGKAVSYWDSDRYYMDNPNHEAGDYIRNFVKRWLPEDYSFRRNEILGNQPKIQILNAGDRLNQAKVAGKLLENQLKGYVAEGTFDAFKDKINDTAILLPDETMLFPLLHSLPEWQDSTLGKYITAADFVNVTMGFSMQYSPLHSLIESVFLLQQNLKDHKNGAVFYHKDVLRLIRHPYVQFMEGKETLNLETQQKIQKDKRVYISEKWLAENTENDDVFEQLFISWGGKTEKAIAYFEQLIELLYQEFDKDKNALELEFLLQFYTTLNKLKNILLAEEEKISVKTFRQFLTEQFKSMSVPFTGEPLGPVQVMGTLESRSLDFENVIILSCNEGAFPQGKILDSLIPFDIRKLFNLPTYKENDSSFAYTFYRLFHKAKTITLIYSEASDMSTSGEKSRFLTQIEKDERLVVDKISLPPQLPVPVDNIRSMEKDEAIIKMVEAAFVKGRSPSAINSYIRNPLEFLLRSIMKLQETEEIEENLDARSFGTLIHETLDRLLMPSIGKNVDAKVIESLSENRELLHQTMMEVIRQEMGQIVVDSGRNFMLYKVAERLIDKFFEQQKEDEKPFFLIAQETFYDHTIMVKLHDGREVPFRITGKADRIDICGDAIRIVDYKTGTFQPAQLKASCMEDLLLDHSKEKIVQLLLYKYLLIKAQQKGETPHLPPVGSGMEVLSGFYFFRKLSSGFQVYKLADEPTEIDDFCAYVEKFLGLFVRDVLNPKKPFTNEPSDFGLLLEI
ncbi:PD-(D/E)XK nuclease family protein [Flammeovirgaceae bacterium SG7u.111]|nr:PD-(D/E)XK nuclease family protein [Flammeovirgaceae bacterium SG7u.132]WPO37871.1 PD-(D/E)XK nuclease family protein [Flammeovirgaceae bacterium SG7u.111]